MTTLTVPRQTEGPLTQLHRDELALADSRAKTIHKAARVAAFHAWGFGIVAALSAPFALFSLVGFLVTVGLTVVAYNEFRGRKRLLQFDPSAAMLLGWNQIGLLTLVAVYCLWMLYVSLAGQGPFAAELQANPDLQAALGSLDEFDHLYRLIAVTLYGSVIVLTAIYQGLTASYYFTRRKHIRAYVQETPGWVIDLQRRTTTA